MSTTPSFTDLVGSIREHLACLVREEARLQMSSPEDRDYLITLAHQARSAIVDARDLVEAKGQRKPKA